MPTKSTWHAWLTLAAILIWAGWLRWSSLADGMWIDELHTAWIVAGNVDDVAPRAMIGNQSPLVYWPFWLWIQAVGLNEYTLRMPFFVSGLLVVALVFGMVWAWSRSLIGAATAALLVAMNNHTIFYGVEARIYAAVQLVGLVHLLLFLDLLYRPSWWRRIAWIALGALLLHMHYTAVLILAVEGISYVVVLYLEAERKPRYSLLSFAMDSTITVLLLVPVLGHLAAIAGRRKNWALTIDAQTYPFTILFIIPIAQMLIAPALLLGFFRDQKPELHEEKSDELPPKWLIWVCLVWMLLPPTALWLASFLDIAQAFHMRYVAISLVSPMVVAGLLIAAAPRNWQQLVMAACTLIIGLGLNATWLMPIMAGQPVVSRKQPWRESVAALNPLLPGSDKPVFVYSGFIESEFLSEDNSDDNLLKELCYSPVRSCYWLNCDDANIHPLRFVDPGKLSTANADLCARHGGWFMIREHNLDTFKRSVEASLRNCGQKGPLTWRQLGPEEMPILELSVTPMPNIE